MSDLVIRSPRSASVRETRQQRAVRAACEAVHAEAQVVCARIGGRALVGSVAMNASAALSHLEASLSTDEVVARRVGDIMRATNAGLTYEVASLNFRV